MLTMMQKLQDDVRAKRSFASALAKGSHKAGKIAAKFHYAAVQARSEHELAVRAQFDAEQALLDAKRRRAS